jgi:hypothetical protein
MLVRFDDGVMLLLLRFVCNEQRFLFIHFFFLAPLCFSLPADLVKASLKQLVSNKVLIFKGQRREQNLKTSVPLCPQINLFLINGFAFNGEVEIASQPSSPGSAAGAKFCLTLTSPANLWGGQSLQFQRAQLDNAYLLKTATELVRRLGYNVVSSSVKYEGNKELSYLSLR